MAEVGAPLAKLDGEDWQEFSDYRLLSMLGLDGSSPAGNEMQAGGSQQGTCDVANAAAVRQLDNAKNDAAQVLLLSKPGNFTVPDVNLTTRHCFRTETRDGVDIISHERLLNDSGIWSQISETYNGAMPVNWNKSHARQLQEHSLNVTNKPENEKLSELIDLSDDEELQQALDLHCLIASSHSDDPDEPVITADQVISEIEEMMMEESMCEDSHRTLDGPSKTAQLVRLKLKQPVPPNMSVKDCLTTLSVKDIIALREELEYTISEYSEVLVQELALREELDFHKESNNQFISLLLNIQRKRRELEADKKKGVKSSPKKPSDDKATASSSPSGTYLTTVIPYDHHEGVPDTERLQIYIKIMTAIDNDSSTVPSILTDYILKVLCPTT